MATGRSATAFRRWQGNYAGFALTTSGEAAESSAICCVVIVCSPPRSLISHCPPLPQLAPERRLRQECARGEHLYRLLERVDAAREVRRAASSGHHSTDTDAQRRRRGEPTRFQAGASAHLNWRSRGGTSGFSARALALLVIGGRRRPRAARRGDTRPGSAAGGRLAGCGFGRSSGNPIRAPRLPCRPQLACTVIRRARARSAFGRCSTSTPPLIWALMPSQSIASLSVKRRQKPPTPYSTWRGFSPS